MVAAAEKDEHFMRVALKEARKAGERGEVPVGAVIVNENGEVLAAAGNSSIAEHDPAGHAEMIVIREAGKKRGNYRLLNTTVYVTIEPCLMCAGAMVHARIARLVYGTPDPKTGALVSQYTIGRDSRLNHEFDVDGGVLAEECAGLLQTFFKERRS